MVESYTMIRPCFKLIGCFLLPNLHFFWLLPPLVLLPTLGSSALSNYRTQLLFFLRQMEGGVRGRTGGRGAGWERVAEPSNSWRRGWGKRNKLPGLRPDYKSLLEFIILHFFFFADIKKKIATCVSGSRQLQRSTEGSIITLLQWEKTDIKIKDRGVVGRQEVRAEVERNIWREEWCHHFFWGVESFCIPRILSSSSEMKS